MQEVGITLETMMGWAVANIGLAIPVDLFIVWLIINKARQRPLPNFLRRLRVLKKFDTFDRTEYSMGLVRISKR